jgi:hypothetical protein
MSIKKFVQTDPQDFANEIGSLAIWKEVTYQSATLTLGTVPANSVITDVIIGRGTAWDAVTTFEVGKSGDTDWLVDTTAANVTGAAGGAEVVTANQMVTEDTDVVLTLNQGAASEGSGFVLVRYVELDRR